jgi:hypothetical protein
MYLEVTFGTKNRPHKTGDPLKEVKSIRNLSVKG